MKKIIKNTMTEPIEMSCGECGSVFTYTYKDIEKKDFGLFGIPNIRRYVDCPVCLYSNSISRTKDVAKVNEED